LKKRFYLEKEENERNVMNEIKIVPLGGVGSVTKNMYVYEYGNELLVVDCGIGFPEEYMYGVDLLIPDVTYLQKRLAEGARIVGLCLTHGHDDHIAALPYVLPMLNAEFPIYGSRLTAAFAKARMADQDYMREVQEYPEQPLHLGSFSIEAISVTHSVPDTRHLVITTPAGILYHGSDFKFDMTPIIGERSEFDKIAEAGNRGILCALVDCLRVERGSWSASEAVIRGTLEKAIRECPGKFIVTLMSSNLHRIQQTVDVAAEHDRKVVFVGRSVEQNVRIAQELGLLNIPKGMYVQKKHIQDYKDEELCVIIAGSQGQPGSSLVRAVYGEHPIINVSKKDKIVFSTEPIPGNEPNVYSTIDEISRNGVEVLYSDIEDNLHVSGHAGEAEQQLLISLLKPKYLFPIGGADRHRVAFEHMAEDLGFSEQQVLLPKLGQIVEFIDRVARLGDTLSLKELMVDGLRIGDVGNIVLADRKKMAEEGMVVVIVPERGGMLYPMETYVVSRGFVFMKNADEIVDLIKETTQSLVNGHRDMGEGELKREIEKNLGERA